MYHRMIFFVLQLCWCCLVAWSLMRTDLFSLISYQSLCTHAVLFISFVRFNFVSMNISFNFVSMNISFNFVSMDISFNFVSMDISVAIRAKSLYVSSCQSAHLYQRHAISVPHWHNYHWHSSIAMLHISIINVDCGVQVMLWTILIVISHHCCSKDKNVDQILITGQPKGRYDCIGSIYR